MTFFRNWMIGGWLTSVKHLRIFRTRISLTIYENYTNIRAEIWQWASDNDVWLLVRTYGELSRDDKIAYIFVEIYCCVPGFSGLAIVITPLIFSNVYTKKCIHKGSLVYKECVSLSKYDNHNCPRYIHWNINYLIYFSY